MSITIMMVRESYVFTLTVAVSTVVYQQTVKSELVHICRKGTAAHSRTCVSVEAYYQIVRRFFGRVVIAVKGKTVVGFYRDMLTWE